MVELLPILSGYCTIQLYRKVGGSNRWSHTIQWVVCGNTLIDEYNFDRFNYDAFGNEIRWLMEWNSNNRSYYARRAEKKNGKLIHISMAREVLGLMRNPGHGGDVGDHWSHDTLDNTLENLRIATASQNSANGNERFSSQRFRGVRPNGNGYLAYITGDKIFFSNVSEVEAALMYNYAAWLIYKEFAKLNIVFEDEMPTYERQWELYDMVIAKLMVKGFSCEDVLKREEFDLCA